MDYLLLGPMVVTNRGQRLPLGGLRQRAVLAALLLAADRAVDTNALIEMVWDDAPPSKPIASLRAYVANLRRILGDDSRLVTDAKGYRLQLGSDQLDTRMFVALLGDGRRLLDSGDAEGASRLLERSLQLWRGAPLSDFSDMQFAHHEIQRLDALRADAVESRFEAELQLGRSRELISELEAELVINPLREQLWAQLMLAMYRAGLRTDALRAYERVQIVLDRELGVRPGLALERLVGEIRSESPGLDWRPPEPVSSRRRLGRDGLCGRSRELERLRTSLRSATEGCGTVAVLTGESGVGKTALATEIADVAENLGMATVWVGHVGGVRKPASWAWMQALRGLAGKTGPQLPDGGLSALLPEWWAQAYDHLNADGAESQTSPELVETTAMAVGELAVRRPALVVLDDLHRAERFTHDVLQWLAASIQRKPMMILATWQNGGMDRPLRERAFDRLLSRCDITTIRLRGIDHQATAELIERVCGVHPTADFVAAVSSRTGGNPFYIRELTRLLYESGRLSDTTHTIDGDDVPDAVSGVIRRRMADLPRRTRSALIAAAMVGVEFDSVRVASVLDSTPAEVAAALESAASSGLIQEITRPRRYRFGHGLVRDAVAAQLTGVARTQMHAKIAQTYADDAMAPADEDSFAGADHAWRAGAELEPTVALRLIDRAVRDARERSAFHEVAELARRALEVCARLPVGPTRTDREAELSLQLASVEAIVKGQSSNEVLDSLERAFDIGSDTGHFTTAVVLRSVEACAAGRYHEGAVLSDGLISLYGSSGDPIAGTGGYFIRAMVEFMRGSLDASLDSIRVLLEDVPTVDWTEHGHLVALDVRGIGIAAWAHALRGDFDRARAALTSGIEMGTSRNDVFGTAVVRIADIQVDAMTGMFAGLAERADEIVADLSRLGIEQLAASARIVSGWARAVGPDGVDTTDEVCDAFGVHSRGGTRILNPFYLALLSDIEAAHRSSAAARTTLRKAELVAASTGERVWDPQLAARRLKLRGDSYRSGSYDGADPV